MVEQMTAVHARVPVKVYLALADAAHAERRSQSQLIRNILVDWYEQRQIEQAAVREAAAAEREGE